MLDAFAAKLMSLKIPSKWAVSGLCLSDKRAQIVSGGGKTSNDADGREEPVQCSTHEGSVFQACRALHGTLVILNRKF